MRQPILPITKPTQLTIIIRPFFEEEKIYLYDNFNL